MLRVCVCVLLVLQLVVASVCAATPHRRRRYESPPNVTCSDSDESNGVVWFGSGHEYATYEGDPAPLLLVAAFVMVDNHAPLANGAVLLYKRRVACVGPAGGECQRRAVEVDATLVRACGSVLMPGLLNVHDHPQYNWQMPAAPSTLYGDRFEWDKGLDGLPKLQYAKSSHSDEAMWIAEVRHLLAGVTSLVGTGALPGLVRNLDSPEYGDRDVDIAIDYEVFPEKVVPPTVNATSPCASFDLRVIPDGTDVFLPHMGEGSDAFAHHVLACGVTQYALSPGVALIHAMQPDDAIIEPMRRGNMSVVWSPRSNLSLYGNTTAIARYLAAGINVALSTDWVVSGSADMTREFACVRYVNASSSSVGGLDGALSDATLLDMVTVNAARAMHVDRWLGSLVADDAYADVALYDLPAATNLSPQAVVTHATPASVSLVIVGGQVQAGNRTLIESLVPHYVRIESIPSSAGKAIAWLDETWGLSERSVAEVYSYVEDEQLTTIFGAAYDSASPPPHEPACVFASSNTTK